MKWFVYVCEWEYGVAGKESEQKSETLSDSVLAAKGHKCGGIAANVTARSPIVQYCQQP